MEEDVEVDQEDQSKESQEHANEQPEALRAAETDGVTGLALDDLSALVAVKFLGHKWLRDRDDNLHEGGTFLCSPKNFKRFEPRYVEADELDKNQRRSNDRYWAASPATDIAAAMEVAQKLMLPPWDGWWHFEYDSELWYASFEADQADAIFKRAETLAEAICRAALAAIDRVRDTRETTT